MDVPDTQRLREESEQLHSAFIEIELDLAQTFCQIAVTSVQADRVQRNIENARRALEMAGKFAQRVERTEHRLPRGLEEKFQEVKALVGNVAQRLQANLV